MDHLGKVGVGISIERLQAHAFENYDIVFLVLDEEDVYDGEVEASDAMRCVGIRFRGSHKEAPLYYQKLLKYISEHGMRVTGFSRERTLIDYGYTNDTEKFVTEIRIPVAES